jgi:hypothetical protein
LKDQNRTTGFQKFYRGEGPVQNTILIEVVPNNCRKQDLGGGCGCSGGPGFKIDLSSGMVRSPFDPVFGASQGGSLRSTGNGTAYFTGCDGTCYMLHWQNATWQLPASEYRGSKGPLSASYDSESQSLDLQMGNGAKQRFVGIPSGGGWFGDCSFGAKDQFHAR